MREEKRRVKVSRSRQVNTYIEVWRTSYWTMHQAEEKYEGSYFQIMASLIFTAFTLEAYLNHIGQYIFICWDDLEQLSPQKKMNIIAEKLGVAKDDGKRPFQTVKKLFKFRNDVAHGKSVPLKFEDQISVTNAELDEYMHKPLELEWERYCNLSNAKRAREDVKSIMQTLHDASGIADDNLFLSGVQLGTETLVTLVHEEKTK